MESQQPSYCHEIRRIYRLIESTSVEYPPVDHLRELGIEARQVDLADGKLQFDPCFFQPQQHNLHEKYPLLDKTQKLRELSFRSSWDRCLRQAADEIAKWVRTGYWSAEDLKSGEETLFKLAENIFAWGQIVQHSDDVGTCSHETLLYMEDLLGAERVNLDLPPQDVPFYLSDLSPLTEGWRYVVEVGEEYVRNKLTMARTKERKGDPELANLYYPHKVRWRIEDRLEDFEPTDPKPHAILWNWVEFAAGVAPQRLTIHEVQSLVRWFMMRAKRSTWRQHRIQPVSHSM
jgi:hypothetical protein